MARESWTDERLDDLSENVNHRFDRVERDLCGLREEMERRFDRVDARFEAIDSKFEKVDSKFDRLAVRLESIQRTMVTGMVGGFLTLAGLILTQT